MSAPTSTDVRARLVETLRRDLIGPGPQDADLARERLKEKPSGWYVTGYLAPVPEPSGPSAGIPEEDDPFEEGDPLVGDDLGADTDAGPARAADDAPEDAPPAVRIRAPSSLGLTVLLDASVREVEVSLSWGDYVTVPPLSDEELLEERADAPDVVWDRVPGKATLRAPPPTDGKRTTITVPDSGGAQRPFGGLQLELHARPYEVTEPDGTKRNLRVLTVMVVNRRSSVRRRYQDVTYAFQVRLAVRCGVGLHPRANMRGFGSKDFDEAIADLHYRDVCEFAVGVTGGERRQRLWARPRRRDVVQGSVHQGRRPGDRGAARPVGEPGLRPIPAARATLNPTRFMCSCPLGKLRP